MYKPLKNGELDPKYCWRRRESCEWSMWAGRGRRAGHPIVRLFPVMGGMGIMRMPSNWDEARWNPYSDIRTDPKGRNPGTCVSDLPLNTENPLSKSFMMLNRLGRLWALSFYPLLYRTRISLFTINGFIHPLPRSTTTNFLKAQTNFQALMKKSVRYIMPCIPLITYWVGRKNRKNSSV